MSESDNGLTPILTTCKTIIDQTQEAILRAEIVLRDRWEEPEARDKAIAGLADTYRDLQDLSRVISSCAEDPT